MWHLQPTPKYTAWLTYTTHYNGVLHPYVHCTMDWYMPLHWHMPLEQRIYAHKPKICATVQLYAHLESTMLEKRSNVLFLFQSPFVVGNMSHS